MTVDGFNAVNLQHIKLVCQNIEAGFDPAQPSPEPWGRKFPADAVLRLGTLAFSSPSARKIEARGARYPAPYQGAVNR